MMKSITPSSKRANSQQQQLKAAETLVNELIKHEEAWPFLKPVDKKLVGEIHFKVFNLKKKKRGKVELHEFFFIYFSFINTCMQISVQCLVLCFYYVKHEEGKPPFLYLQLHFTHYFSFSLVWARS